MKTTKKAVISGFAMIGAAVLLAGCGAAPESAGGASAGAGAGASDYLPCMVSDAGGFDDKSFNQLGKEGVDEAASELGSKTPIEVESQAETDYASNLQNLVDQGCNTIVTVGFLLAPAALESAKANPDLEYVSIDDTVDSDFDGQTDAPNIKPIIFDTAQAAYLAGYLAAGTSKTGVVGTFGGLNIPTVSIFMDGFAQGVEKYNTDNGTSVRVVGWDRAPGRLLHRRVRGQRHRASDRPGPHRPERRRAPARRRPDLPVGRRRDQAMRSRDRPGRCRRRRLRDRPLGPTCC